MQLKVLGFNTIQSLVHALGYTLDDIDTIPRRKTDPSISGKAMKIAKDYYSLDKWGKQVVRSVIADEQARCKEERQVHVVEFKPQRKQEETAEEIPEEQKTPIPFWEDGLEIC